MTLIIDSGYTVQFPTSPEDEDVYVDPNTGISWTYDGDTTTWSET